MTQYKFQKYAVMMEYVILSVLIAAAVCAVLIVFSRDIIRLFNTASVSATQGNAAGAERIEQYRKEHNADAQTEKEHHKNMTQAGEI